MQFKLTRAACSGLEAFGKLSLLARLSVTYCSSLSISTVDSFGRDFAIPELYHLAGVGGVPNSYRSIGGYLSPCARFEPFRRS